MNFKFNKISLLTALWGAFLFHTPASYAVPYTYIAINDPNNTTGSQNVALGINNRGQVAGTAAKATPSLVKNTILTRAIPAVW